MSLICWKPGSEPRSLNGSRLDDPALGVFDLWLLSRYSFHSSHKGPLPTPQTHRLDLALEPHFGSSLCQENSCPFAYFPLLLWFLLQSLHSVDPAPTSSPSTCCKFSHESLSNKLVATTRATICLLFLSTKNETVVMRMLLCLFKLKYKLIFFLTDDH